MAALSISLFPFVCTRIYRVFSFGLRSLTRSSLVYIYLSLPMACFLSGLAHFCLFMCACVFCVITAFNNYFVCESEFAVDFKLLLVLLPLLLRDAKTMFCCYFLSFLCYFLGSYTITLSFCNPVWFYNFICILKYIRYVCMHIYTVFGWTDRQIQLYVKIYLYFSFYLSLSHSIGATARAFLFNSFKIHAKRYKFHANGEYGASPGALSVTRSLVFLFSLLLYFTVRLFVCLFVWFVYWQIKNKSNFHHHHHQRR